MSQVSFKKAAIAAALSVGMSTNAMAGQNNDTISSNHNSENTTTIMDSKVAKGWAKARKLSDMIKNAAAKGQYWTKPPKPIINNGYNSSAITMDSLELTAQNDAAHGVIRTYVAAVVAPGTSGLAVPSSLGGILSVDEWLDKGTHRAIEVQKMAHRAMVEFAEYGAFVHGIKVVEHDPNDVMDGVPMKNAIVIVMGDHPIEILPTLAEAEKRLKVMWALNMHVTPDEEFTEKYITSDNNSDIQAPSNDM